MLEYPLKYANRHGLITGATGTGKTYTIAGLAEHMSFWGAASILIDVKGDLTGLSRTVPHRLIDPLVNWQTSIRFIGPELFGKILKLSPVQNQVLAILFQLSCDHGLTLDSLDDFKELLRLAGLNLELIARDYGPVNASTLQYIHRALIGIDKPCFFGQQSCPSAFLASEDYINALRMREIPKNLDGCVSFIQARELIKTPALYTAWIISLLKFVYNTLEEDSDIGQPVLNFFIDEAHLLFNDTPGPVLQELESIVRLIRSKGVALWFVTQNPWDIPAGILSQLGNRIQHGMRGATIADKRAMRASVETMPDNPGINALELVQRLKPGEALYSFIDDNDGTPAPVQVGMMKGPSVPLKPLEAHELPQKVVALQTFNKVDEPSKRRWWFSRD